MSKSRRLSRRLLDIFRPWESNRRLRGSVTYWIERMSEQLCNTASPIICGFAGVLAGLIILFAAEYF